MSGRRKTPHFTQGGESEIFNPGAWEMHVPYHNQRRVKMKKTVLNVLAVIMTAAALLAPRPAAAEGEGSASLGVYSNYVWRGQTLSEDAVLQPTVGISWEGFGANLWANYDFDSEELNETDVTLSYSGSYGKVGYEAGYIYYGLDGLADTQEIYLGLSYDFFLSPSATFYLDVDEGNGGFLVLAVGYSVPITEAIGIDLGADVTVNFENAILGLDEEGEEFTGFYNADITAGTSIPFAGAWSFDALLAYSFALTDDAKAAIGGASVDGEDDVFWGGAGVTLAF
jgi:hypothetical protein